MSECLAIHPVTPQPRLVTGLVKSIREGALAVYPTDTCYAIGCLIGNKQGMERIRRIRRLDDKHQFALLCRDLSDIALYAKVDNSAYRLLKALTPGPYTFILKATHEVPRRLQMPKRKSIGIRVPDHCLLEMVLAELGEGMMSSTLHLPGEAAPLSDPDEIRERMGHSVDVIVDSGAGGLLPTTIVDLTEGEARIVRQGKGATDWLSHGD